MELEEAAELFPVGHQGEMSRHGFVQREWTGGVVTCAVGASLCPIRFQARTLFGMFHGQGLSVFSVGRVKDHRPKPCLSKP